MYLKQHLDLETVVSGTTLKVEIAPLDVSPCGEPALAAALLLAPDFWLPGTCYREERGQAFPERVIIRHTSKGRQSPVDPSFLTPAPCDTFWTWAES